MSESPAAPIPENTFVVVFTASGVVGGGPTPEEGK